MSNHITDHSKNKMIVNDEEVIYSDNEMREFFESFVEGHTKAYYNLSKAHKEMKSNYEKKLKLLRSELHDIIGEERTKLLFESLDK
jgi:hypothetical protein